jgi:hypothetical protein
MTVPIVIISRLIYDASWCVALLGYHFPMRLWVSWHTWSVKNDNVKLNPRNMLRYYEHRISNLFIITDRYGTIDHITVQCYRL